MLVTNQLWVKDEWSNSHDVMSHYVLTYMILIMVPPPSGLCWKDHSARAVGPWGSSRGCTVVGTGTSRLQRRGWVHPWCSSCLFMSVSRTWCYWTTAMPSHGMSTRTPAVPGPRACCSSHPVANLMPFREFQPSLSSPMTHCPNNFNIENLSVSEQI